MCERNTRIAKVIFKSRWRDGLPIKSHTGSASEHSLKKTHVMWGVLCRRNTGGGEDKGLMSGADQWAWGSMLPPDGRGCPGERPLTKDRAGLLPPWGTEACDCLKIKTSAGHEMS